MPFPLHRVLSVFVLTGGILAGGSAAFGQVSLWVDAAGLHDYAADGDPTIVRSRPIEVDLARLAEMEPQPGGTLPFDLFDDVSLIGVVERVEAHSSDGYTLIGRLSGEDHGGFTLVAREGVLVANIHAPARQGRYQIRYLGGGVHVVREMDDSAFPPCGVTAEHAPLGPVTPASQGGGGRNCDDDGSVIDVLVLYTPPARTAVGGTDAMYALIDLAIAESNTAYANSLINPQLRLAHRAETDYDESGTFNTHLYRLRDPADGYMDEIHALRELYRADLVTLLVNHTEYCGIAYLMRELSPDFEEWAFSVVAQTCATGNYTFGHELGHNQGCHHDRANASGPGVFEYSYGYQDPTELFRTVMAYSCPGGCPRVQHFSNPDVTYQGLPTGVSIDEPNSAHNALTIDNTALTVANFRKYYDCNDNGICDDEDLAGGTSQDCNNNGLPDECEWDCNNNGIPDDCDVAAGTSEDCNGNSIPDECTGMEKDCNDNLIPDECDIADGTSEDEDGNGVPDECQQVYHVRVSAPSGGDGVSWATAFNDLQDALAAGLEYGDGVWVASGTYKPAGPWGNRSATFQLINGVGIYGGFAGWETSLDQRDIAANATVLSGDLNGDDGPGPGGGASDCCIHHDTPGCESETCSALVCEEDPFCCTQPWDELCVSLAIRFCCDICTTCDNSLHIVTGIYSDTTAILDGFTITAGNAESPSCPLSNNYGGGMLNEYGSPTVRNCVFHENRANNVGGGMANRYGSSPTLSNCVFSENAAHHGGGMSNYHASSPLVVDSRFLGNSVSFNGGAVIADGDDVAPSFINCDFRGNSAVGGGGIWGHGHPTLINCTFSGNQAGRGGAVCIGSGGSSVITNCTFSGNSGGAVAGISPAPIEVDNCVFWGNTDSGTGDESAQIEGGVLTIDYSCVQGWTGDLGGTGNFGDDPLLVDADGEDGMAGTEDDDLRLGPASPCIDAGNNEALPPTVITDMDGAPRFVDNALVPDTGFGTPPIIDMGAYEHSLDCNGNGIPDDQDIVGGTSEDCNENLVPDECEAPSDCNDNGVHDGCDIRDGYSYDANGNGIPDECEIPLVTAEGSRYLGVIPADLPCAVALLVTSPDYTCLAKYVDTTGTLTDSPVYHTPSEWGTAHVRGLEIVPNATYTIQTDFGEGVLSGAASATTWQWADTDNNDFINIGDVLLLVQAFTGDFSYVAFEAVDLYPCATDRFINIDDVLQGVVAFQGGTWEDTNCPAPCP